MGFRKNRESLLPPPVVAEPAAEAPKPAVVEAAPVPAPSVEELSSVEVAVVAEEPAVEAIEIVAQTLESLASPPSVAKPTKKTKNALREQV